MICISYIGTERLTLMNGDLDKFMLTFTGN